VFPPEEALRAFPYQGEAHRKAERIMADTTEKNPDAADETGAEEKKRYESEIENVGPCKVLLKVKVPAETVTEELDSRYREIIRTVAFPGFRIGHAPRRLVEKKLGEEVVADVKETILTESFKEAMEEHDLDPITDPDVDLEGLTLEPDQPIEYSATLLVRPTVEIPEYSEITVKRVAPEVDEAKIDETIDAVRRERAVLEPVPDGKLEEDGVAVVNVTISVEDEEILDRENVEYQHPAQYLTGFRLKSLADEILGKGAGDELTVTEKLPDTWPVESQAGKEVTAAISVQEVKRYVLPELDEEFVEALDYDSVEEFRDDVRSQVERQAEAEAQEATDKKIMDALIEAAPFELPEDVVKEETSRRIERIQAMMRMQGASDSEVEEKVAEAKSSEREEVERDFRSGFLVEAIAGKEKIFVTESEVEDRIAQMAAAYHRSVEEMEQYLEQRGMLSSIRSRMREEKVVELLRNRVKIED
jgi:trigger factor